MSGEKDPRSVHTALLVSPHLDDVAFSCGGIAALLARHGWIVRVATCFTRSIHPASGFALACQRDKGLPDDTDYMALRREEDRAACAALGVLPLWLDLPEAPHRGYGSATALFSALADADDVAPILARRLAALLDEDAPNLLLLPQGCGGHVDHRRTIEAGLVVYRSSARPPELGFYRDTPYVIRNPAARPDPLVAAVAVHDLAVPLDAEALAAKQRAVACYATQLGFQFGDAAQAASCIELLMRAEAEDGPDALAERLLLLRPLSEAGRQAWPTGW